MAQGISFEALTIKCFGKRIDIVMFYQEKSFIADDVCPYIDAAFNIFGKYFLELNLPSTFTTI